MRLFLVFTLLFLNSCIFVMQEVDYDTIADLLKEKEYTKPEYISNSIFIKNGMILLQGTFTLLKAEIVSEQILKLSKENEFSKITILINSPGGQEGSYLLISNTIKSIDKQVDVICVGYCFSASCAVLQAATGQRLAFKDSKFMVHPPFGNKDLKKISIETYTEAVSHRSNLPSSWFPLDTEHFFNANEAIQYNFIDGIIESYLPKIK